MGSVLSIVNNGLGIFTLVWTALSFAASCVFIWFFGNRLLNRSSFWRFALLMASTLFSVLGAVSTAKMGWEFVHTFSIGTLALAAITGASCYMHVRSFRVLTDDSVKAYVNN